MKTFARIIVWLVMLLCGVQHGLADDKYVCKDPDEIPTFVGGLLDGLPKFMKQHFKFPKEAWKPRTKTHVLLDLVITKKGTVSDVKCLSDIHPAVEQELVRVIKQTKWYPATVKGNPVDVAYKLHVELTPNFLEGDPIPFGLEYIITDADKSIKKLRNFLTMPIMSELTPMESALAEAAEVFVNFPRFPINYALLKNAMGEGDKAVETMDSCWKYYHWERNPADGPLVIRNSSITGYNGRTEIWVALMRALQHQSSRSERTDSTYRDAFMLINGRILDNDLRESPTRKEREFSEKRMQRLQREMVNEFVGYDMVGRDVSGWDRITRQYSLDEVSGTLAYASRNGYLNNAQVEQLSRLIREEYEATGNGKYATKDTHMKLFGTKAFAVWMHGGDEALGEFLATIRSRQPTGKLLKYLAKLEKRMSANRELLADRGAVLECLTSIAPPAGSDAEAVKLFYDRRKAAEKIFPLEWLMK